MKTDKVLQKQQLITELKEARNQILDAISLLNKNQMDVIYLGTWSIFDLLAHLVGWDHTNLQAVQALLENKLPLFFNQYDTDWNTYNAKLIKEHKVDHISEMMSKVEHSHQNLVTFLESLPAEDFEKEHGVRTARNYNVTIARLLKAESTDERVHARQIREAFIL
jgi:hypothetical protein